MAVENKHDLAKKRIIEAARPLIGKRGFSGVGISQILEVAQVPKGSFYHYFESKEKFGEDLLRLYIHDYLADMECLSSKKTQTGYELVSSYFERWRITHVGGRVGDKCLIVKLAAEISDLSEDMRVVMDNGVAAVIKRLAAMIKAGQKDRSISSSLSAHQLATSLYQLWLGATLMAKITHAPHPFDEAWQTSIMLLNTPK
ncbi:TetR/AcrR family transcriptional regulator [Acetobacter senegalensis]|uniref:TetR/AcrR family transcriptional regulator n=1 Tax=Acetobacter senegalensis TaxID=446692 RepID=UPI00264F19A5|nr:TetR/AcrR family transcriptional regulator [Acetobacter senegalensis]MDN7350398.1 TetR/AcrR family transcriptional regulator [Acetobacter senegalensis]